MRAAHVMYPSTTPRPQHCKACGHNNLLMESLACVHSYLDIFALHRVDIFGRRLKHSDIAEEIGEAHQGAKE